MIRDLILSSSKLQTADWWCSDFWYIMMSAFEKVKAIPSDTSLSRHFLSVLRTLQSNTSGSPTLYVWWRARCFARAFFHSFLSFYFYIIFDRNYLLSPPRISLRHVTVFPHIENVWILRSFWLHNWNYHTFDFGFYIFIIILYNR